MSGAAWAWQARAACRGMDLELFFPQGAQPPSPYAIAACQRCPVTAECYAAAASFSAEGVWAGMTRDERRAQQRRDTRAALTAARRQEAAA